MLFTSSSQVVQSLDVITHDATPILIFSLSKPIIGYVLQGHHLTKMTPLCSTGPICSYSSKTCPHISFCSSKRTISSVHKSIVQDRSFFNNNGNTTHYETSFKIYVSRSLSFPVVENIDQTGCIDCSMFSPYHDKSDDIVRGLPNLNCEPDNWGSSINEINGSLMDNGSNYFASFAVSEKSDQVLLGDNTHELNIGNNLDFPAAHGIDLQPLAAVDEDLLNLHDAIGDSAREDTYEASFGAEPVSSSVKSIVSESSASISHSFETANEGISDLKNNLDNLFSGLNEYMDNSYNSFTFSIKDNVDGVTRSFDKGITDLLYNVENAKQQVGGKLVINVNRAGVLAVDNMRHAIVSLEDVVANAASFVVYSYESIKILLPVEARNVLNVSEEKVTGILKPLASTLEQAFTFFEEFGRSLGLNLDDPIVPFVIILGTSAALGISYWTVQYSGYSGDLSPELTLEMLKNEESALLVDVRPEDLKEREGIPDLRRGARLKYTSITFPKVDNSAQKLRGNGRDIDEVILAVVIRNLKNVRDGSKVIIMDARGEQSKGIARYLRKFGVKRPYLLQGGFLSWMRNGLRIKQLKAETTFTILNEEAEAILEDIRPTPSMIIGYGLVVSAAIYALLEWEKTLQLIGIVGFGKTLYQRIASYEDSEDFKQDLRLLLTPVTTLGAQALSWTSRKEVGTKKNGLPTSPSSTAVQDRVLQAAAKHESQPSDSGDGVQDVDLSE